MPSDQDVLNATAKSGNKELSECKMDTLSSTTTRTSSDDWNINIIHTENFPCLVEGGKDAEDPDTTNDENEKMARIARNGLRHLTYGVSFTDAHLVNWRVFKLLMIDNNPQLFTALRTEMQKIFNQAFDYVKLESSKEAQKQVQILVYQVLTAYPFTDPKENETVVLPQKIQGTWQQVRYHFERIDISPQTGLLAKLIEPKDRIYAFGLVAEDHPAAPNLLCLQGTSAPWEKNKDLNWLYNFKPNTSVGEGHDDTHIAAWMPSHPQLHLMGMSKGGTMAMILAAKFPQYVRQSHCYNPTALCDATLQRLESNWNKLPLNERPRINVYTQAGDPVFLIENRFLEHTNFYQMSKTIEEYAKLQATAHYHYFAGHKAITIKQVEFAKIDTATRTREFVTDIKNTLNWIMFPFMYIQLVLKLCARKVNRFCSQHSTALSILCFTLALSVALILFATGMLSPLAWPLIEKCGAPLAYMILGSLILTVSAGYAIVAPKLMSLGTEMAIGSSFIIGSISAFITTMSFQAILSGVKIGVKSLFGFYPTPAPTNIMIPETKASTQMTTTMMSNTLKRNKSETDLAKMQNHEHTIKRSHSEAQIETPFITNRRDKEESTLEEIVTRPEDHSQKVTRRK